MYLASIKRKNWKIQIMTRIIIGKWQKKNKTRGEESKHTRGRNLETYMYMYIHVYKPHYHLTGGMYTEGIL